MSQESYWVSKEYDPRSPDNAHTSYLGPPHCILPTENGQHRCWWACWLSGVFERRLNHSDTHQQQRPQNSKITPAGGKIEDYVPVNASSNQNSRLTHCRTFWLELGNADHSQNLLRYPCAWLSVSHAVPQQPHSSALARGPAARTVIYPTTKTILRLPSAFSALVPTAAHVNHSHEPVSGVDTER